MSIGNFPDGNSPEDERPFEEHREEGLSVGRALRQARIKAGLTVDDVSNATRVRIAIVHAIEQDDFAPCGGDVYARGHIRTLAQGGAHRSGPAAGPRRRTRRATRAHPRRPDVRGGTYPSRAPRAELDRRHGRGDRRRDRLRRVHRGQGQRRERREVVGRRRLHTDRQYVHHLGQPQDQQARRPEAQPTDSAIAAAPPTR